MMADSEEFESAGEWDESDADTIDSFPTFVHPPPSHPLPPPTTVLPSFLNQLTMVFPELNNNMYHYLKDLNSPMARMAERRSSTAPRRGPPSGGEQAHEKWGGQVPQSNLGIHISEARKAESKRLLTTLLEQQSTMRTWHRSGRHGRMLDESQKNNSSSQLLKGAPGAAGLEQAHGHDRDKD